MIREEQIREAASAYRINDGEGVRGWEEAAFEAGARWADAHPQWISVKDRLPEVFDGDLFRSSEKQTKTVLTTNGHGSIVLNVWNGHQWEYYGDVAFWMPIPALPRLVDKL